VSTSIERLLIIQERDRRINQLTREHEDIPARCKEIESRLQVHRESLKTAQEELKKNGAAIKQIEGDIEAQRQRISKFREQQFQIKSNEEYRALEREIAAVQKGIGNLEDRELTVMEQMDGLRRDIAEREQDLKKEESRVVEDQSVLNQRLQNIQREIHDLKVDRDALAKDVDPAWLSRYERILKRTGDYAVVPVESSACGGCHMNLPPHLIHDARKNMAMTQCSYCSRILYWQP